MRFFFSFSAVLLGLPMLLCAQSQSTRPPVTGIANVSVYASNVARSSHFYSGSLGFSESGTTKHLYRVNSQQTIRVDPLPQGVTDYLESVAFATPDLEGLRRYLVDKGVQVPEKIERRADGVRLFWVKDPEGHRIGFVQAGRARVVPVTAHAQDEQVSSHILHAGFVVHDRAAEDHFFRDILGFRQGWQGGMKDGTTDWVDMQVPDGGDWIEYMMHGPVLSLRRKAAY